MKRRQLLKSLLCACLIILPSKLYAQERINLDDIKFGESGRVYIFYGTPTLTKCDQNGTALAGDDFPQSDAPDNSTFQIYKQLTANTYLIKFLPWSTRKGLFESYGGHNENLVKALTYNFVSPTGTFTAYKGKSKNHGKINVVTSLKKDAYFTITIQDLKNYAIVYKPKTKYEFNYGTISYLGRIRPRNGNVSGRWSTDLSLGLTAGFRRNIGKNFGISLLAGIAITKVNLDSISTNGVVKSTSEKPAFTPSLNILFSFQNFSLGLGAGMDWINVDSPETAAWIYNKNIFYAVGFGINIFRSSSNENLTKIQDQ